MPAIAYLFPGQGAQAVGMGKAFYDASSDARDLYKTANSAVGFDLTALCFEGQPEELTRTDRCQLVLFVTSLAALEALRRAAPSLQPAGMAGLSLGELTALAAANAFSFKDGLYLVQARGEAMAQCAVQHPGAMLAVVGLPEAAVEEICRASGASGANYNAPEQVVLSGPVSAIGEAERLATARGAKRVVRLEVSGAFHSPLMQPAAEALKRALGKIALRPITVPVVSNVTGQFVREPEEIRDLLVRQLVSPVRWEASIRHLLTAGATYFIEFPPARVLTGLLRCIDKTATGIAVDEPKDFEKLGDMLPHQPA